MVDGPRRCLALVHGLKICYVVDEIIEARERVHSRGNIIRQLEPYESENKIKLYHTDRTTLPIAL